MIAKVVACICLATVSLAVPIYPDGYGYHGYPGYGGYAGFAGAYHPTATYAPYATPIAKGVYSAPAASFSTVSINKAYASPYAGYAAAAPLIRYAAPAPVYHAPAPVYHAPAVVAAPAPVYHAPAPVYHAPAVVAAPAVAVAAAPAIVKPHVDYVDPNPQYSYSYGVTDYSTGDSKHAEETLVNGVVHGSYSLAEPDGTIRKVTYTADKIHGFNAVVEKKAAVAAVAHAPVAVAHAPVAVAHAPVAAVAPSLGYGYALHHR